MNWAKRLARVFLGDASLLSSRRKPPQHPRTRRVAVEPLEDRRLLSGTSVGVIYVDDDAPNDPGVQDTSISDPLEDGTSDHPFDSIQEALLGAEEGNTVNVADGYYLENIIWPGTNGVTLQSASGYEATTIDGRSQQESVICVNNGTEGVVIRGFTITGGLGSKAIRRSGGGILVRDDAVVSVEACRISGNGTDQPFGGDSWGTYGAALYVGYRSEVDLLACLITENVADEAIVYYRTFSEQSGTIRNCVVSGNRETQTGTVYLQSSSPSIENCTIVDNVATSGAGIHVFQGAPEIRNNILAFNEPYGLYIHNTDAVVVEHNIIWGNSNEWGYREDFGGPNPYGDLLSQNGNMSVEPLFRDNNDYHLREGSPAIDVGADVGLETDIDGDIRPMLGGFDIGADEFMPMLDQDLGTVDYLELLSVDTSVAELVYALSTANAGRLTADATFVPSVGDVTLRLLDNQGQLIDEVTGTDGYLRIDHIAPAEGTAYEVQLTGTNTSVDLRLCNLISQTGDSVEIFDTEVDDTFFFSAAQPFDLTANGVEYHFDDAYNFTFHSTAGDDVVEVEDSEGDDTLTTSPTQMILAGTLPGGESYSATADKFPYAHGYARNGGTDSAQLTGSEYADRVKIYPDYVKVIGTGYYHRAKLFETVIVDTLDGVDRAAMFGSEDADAVWAKKNELRFDYQLQLETGEQPNFDELDYDVTVLNTEFVVARAASQNDWLELHDSALNDVLIARPHKTEIMNGPRAADGIVRGDEYRIVARGFRNVSAIADQGGDGDVAKLYDSGDEGVDIWAAGYRDGETWSTMSSPTRLLYEVLAFEQVGGYGFNYGLGENHGTNRKDHADDVDFVFQYGDWEGDVPNSSDTDTSTRSTGRGNYAGR